MTDHAKESTTAPDASTQLALERTVLSYERTMLSWIRTAASLITFGFGIYSFHRIATGGVEQSALSFGPHEFALLMVSIGLLSLLLAVLEDRRSMLALEARYPTKEQYPVIPRSRARVLAALIAMLGLLALFLMIFRE